MNETRSNPKIGARMQDVAKKAGVSVMTVSRALSDPGKVSAKTLKRVQDAVQDVRYLPNELAGSLSSRRSNVVGLIIPGISNSLYAGTVQEISSVLRARGYHLMIADSGLSLENEEQAIAAFLAQRVCGLILHNTQHTARAKEMIAQIGAPTIEIGNLAKRPLYHCVSYSSFAAAKAMTVHLARLGYRRIGFASLPVQTNDRAKERQLGYFAAMEELGLGVDPSLAVETEPGFQGGADALKRLVEACPTIQAVFFSADVMAVGALFECQRRGWSVPSRIAIASFDDVELLRHVLPTITTLRIPRDKIGRRSAELLIASLDGRITAPSTVDLGFEIIQREST